MTVEEIKKAVEDAAAELKKDNDVSKENANKALEDATKALEAIKEKTNEIKSLQDEVDELRNKIKGLGGSGKKITLEQAVAKNVTELADKIKKAAKGETVEFTIKAAELVTTANADNPDGIPDIVGVQIAPPGRVNLRTAIIDSLVSRFATDLPAYPYTESLPKDGDFDFVEEGEEKPELDLVFETRYAQPVKAAGWVHITEEALQDIRGIQSIITGLLKDKHDLRKMRGILFGTGSNGQPTGATVLANPFVAGSLAGSVSNPNIMDVINAAITKVYTTHNFTDEMPYKANLVLLNPVDFFSHFVAAKDDMGRPLYPQATLFNEVVIGGVRILPEEMITAGKIFVADMSKYNVSEYTGYRVEIGRINDDFIKNQLVILGESRFHAFVKELDKVAFIYDDISNIKDALEATT